MIQQGPKVIPAPGDLFPDSTRFVVDPWKLLIAEEARGLTKEETFFNHDVMARVLRYSFMILNVVILLSVLYKLTDDGRGGGENWLIRVIGINVAFQFTVYFAVLGIQLYPGMRRVEEAYLFKVVTRMSTVPDWAAMRVANTQLLYLYRPIQSISEFSAISGGQANQMLSTLGPMCWVAVAVVIGSEMQCDTGRQFQLSAASTLVLIGLAGIVMIGMFELNHYDRAMKAFHYLGVGMAIAILFAVLIQGVALAQTKSAGYLVVPFLTNLVAWPCFAYWQFISSQSNAERFENEFKAHKEQHGEVDADFIRMLKRKINRMSVQCVVFEGAAIYSVTLSFAWYLFAAAEYCHDDCNGQWFCRHYCVHEVI